MIRIQDALFKKQAGGQTLDRAAVVVIGIDLREDRPGSPGIRCDLAWGTEDGQGKFVAYDYNSDVTTRPVYVEPHIFQGYKTAAGGQAMTQLRGVNLLEAIAFWFEAQLVAGGKFGEGATVA